ncbi:MAG: DUF4058 family protein [Phormidesmis sp.]
MSSPFPGMNPYLENPELWPEVHSRQIVLELPGRILCLCHFLRIANRLFNFTLQSL